MDDTAIAAAIRALLERSGRDAARAAIEPCAAGGNNRVYRVRAGNETIAAKCYFRHEADARDRLGAEFSFVEYAHASGIADVPRPLARDDATRVAFYEFVPGRKLQADELTATHVQQALHLFRRLNAPAARRLGGPLPDAAEACFSIAEHVQLVQRRIDRLTGIPAEAGAAAFPAELGARWLGVRAHALAAAAAAGLDASAPLPADERCISPSDFGFHNAIERAPGRLAFIDFEYSGWDDPAKAVGDFFAQPAVPVDRAHLDAVLEAFLAHAPRPEKLAARTRALLPIFQIKWCCIMMNDFLPALLQRRRFADPGLDPAERKARQLDKARRLLQAIH
jgi:hypothetical protein